MTSAGVLSASALKIFGKHEIGEGTLTRVEEHELISHHLHVPMDRIFSLRQIHSDRIVQIDAGQKAGADGELPEADALISDLPGACLVIRTADCLPVLISATVRRKDGRTLNAIGAAHAGWRGLAAGIVEKTILKVVSLVEHDAEEMQFRIDLGPAISGAVYEVGSEVAAHFTRKKQSPKPGKFLVDLAENSVLSIGAAFSLEAAALLSLLPKDDGGQDRFTETIWKGARVGITLSRSLFACTMLDNDRYFSHRKGDTGRNLNVILLSEVSVHG